MVRRREVLSAMTPVLSGALSGCNAIGKQGSPARRSQTENSFTFKYTTAKPGPLEFEPDAVKAPNFDWSLEKVAPATKSRPCRLRITATNTGSTREMTAEGKLPLPTLPGDLAEGDGTVKPVIVPVDSDIEPGFNGDCWQAGLDDPELADDAPWDWGHGGERSRRIEGGEQLVQTYFVVASWTTLCFQSGEYRFDHRYSLGGEQFEWGFTLKVPSYSRAV